jgi:hypothetical protein
MVTPKSLAKDQELYLLKILKRAIRKRKLQPYPKLLPLRESILRPLEGTKDPKDDTILGPHP